jgi:hypothetical protein
MSWPQIGGMTDREDAWGAVHEALPAGWTVGPPTYDPGVSAWSVTARSKAGTTTTMRCVFGLARPDRGEVRSKGAVVDRDTRLRFGRGEFNR